MSELPALPGSSGHSLVAAKIRNLAGSTLAEAAVQAIPYVGGPLATLLYGSGARRRVQRLEQFVEDLATKAMAIDEARLDKEFLQSEEFEGILERTVVYVAHEHDDRKRGLFRNLLLNLAHFEFSKEQEKDSYLRILERMSVPAVLALRATFEYAKECQDETQHILLMSERGLKDRVRRLGVPDELVDAALNELEQLGCLVFEPSEYRDMDGNVPSCPRLVPLASKLYRLALEDPANA